MPLMCYHADVLLALAAGTYIGYNAAAFMTMTRASAANSASADANAKTAKGSPSLPTPPSSSLSSDSPSSSASLSHSASSSVPLEAANARPTQLEHHRRVERVRRARQDAEGVVLALSLAPASSLAPVFRVAEDLVSAPRIPMGYACTAEQREAMTAGLPAFCGAVDKIMRDANATVAYGAYDERRFVYRNAKELFKSEDPESERCVHLGVDLFRPAGTPLATPLAGRIHSVRNNAGALDYGPTVVVEHTLPLPRGIHGVDAMIVEEEEKKKEEEEEKEEVEEEEEREAAAAAAAAAAITSKSASSSEQASAAAAAVPPPPPPLQKAKKSTRRSEITFYTLYGHLSRASLSLHAEGAEVAAGDVIGWLGDESVNGGWPPHVHFQIVTDLGGEKGHFVGVCSERDRDLYLGGLVVNPWHILARSG